MSGMSSDVCIRGHSLSGDNLYIRPDNGRRQCRTCQRDRQRQPATDLALQRNYLRLVREQELSVLVRIAESHA